MDVVVTERHSQPKAMIPRAHLDAAVSELLALSQDRGARLRHATRHSPDDPQAREPDIADLLRAELRDVLGAEPSRKDDRALINAAWREYRDLAMPTAIKEGLGRRIARAEEAVAKNAELSFESRSSLRRFVSDCRARNVGNAAIAGVPPSSFELSGVYLRGAELRGAELRGADLHDTDLHGADLREANLSHANLTGADLATANLTGSDVSDAQLTRARLFSVLLAHADLSNSDLTGAMANGADLRDARLIGARLSGAQMINADLRGADLSGADVRRAFLLTARLVGAQLTGADLTKAHLGGADLTRADLSGADLRGAWLFGARLREAVLSGADLRNPSVYWADLDGAIWTLATEWPAELADSIREVSAVLPNGRFQIRGRPRYSRAFAPA